ncbi:vitamin D 25-hydroxylase-like [Antedon mediterranea]|uniref:vitamin D 25-hydroxylase-like n=1 Tax=Antedon mediterranea TaxID=105859 RepID=UPI003AF768FE
MESWQLFGTQWVELRYVLLACIIFTFFWKSIIGRQSLKLPPGPKGWPLLGILPMLADGERVYKKFTKIAAEHGAIFSARLGMFHCVVLNDYEIIREATCRSGDMFLDRPRTPLFEILGGGKGIGGAFYSEGWKDHRRFSLKMMRSYGVGQAHIEPMIAREAWFLNKEFASENGKPFNPTPYLGNATANVICAIMFGNRFKFDDPWFVKMMTILGDMGHLFKVSGPINCFPFLRHIPFSPYKKLRKLVDDHYIFLDKKINEVKLGYVEANPRQFIDAYLDEVRKREVDGYVGTLDEAHLKFDISDMFNAGTETSANTLKWAVLYLALYPEIQVKVQDEMDLVIGRKRMPLLSDRSQLPYTMATLAEVQRIGCIAPLSVPHAATEDTTLRGYDIPKGTIVTLNIWSVMFDPEVWPEPEKFKPERFLNENGCYSKNEKLIPFSIGRRNCVGEQLAVMELFIYFTHLLHRFKLKYPDEEPTPDLEGFFGATLGPYPYKVCALERSLDFEYRQPMQRE